MYHEVLQNKELTALRDRLNEPTDNQNSLEAGREEFREAAARQALQKRLEYLLADATEPSVASWFVCDTRGLQMARAPSNIVIGRNYAWRTYFHGGPADLDPNWRPTDGERLKQTTLSTVFRSQATGRWIVGISTPVVSDGEFLGVVALTVEVGSFVNKLERSEGQLAVLVDWRDGANKGLIIQHPLFDNLNLVPDHFKDYKIPGDGLPEDSLARQIDYRDPFAADKSGQAYQGRWLADAAPVAIRGSDSRLRVIVQEKHNHAVGATLAELKSGLIRIGVIALAGAAIVITLLWGFVARTFGGDTTTPQPNEPFEPRLATPDDMPTVSYEERE
jgi:hypothetical protein